MRKYRFTAAAIVLALAATISAAPSGGGPTLSTWGARAAATDTAMSIDEMLRYAIEDEYFAHAEYAAIMTRFGTVTPFSNIVRSEESHIAWLKEAYAAAGLSVPKDEAAALAIAPANLKAAFETGVGAEIENIAMYDSFLATSLLAKAENASLRALFVRLRDASKNHLSAFKNGLSKY